MVYRILFLLGLVATAAASTFVADTQPNKLCDRCSKIPHSKLYWEEGECKVGILLTECRCGGCKCNPCTLENPNSEGCCDKPCCKPTCHCNPCKCKENKR
jgi:hypothetical protein